MDDRELMKLAAKELDDAALVLMECGRPIPARECAAQAHALYARLSAPSPSVRVPSDDDLIAIFDAHTNDVDDPEEILRMERLMPALRAVARSAVAPLAELRREHKRARALFDASEELDPFVESESAQTLAKRADAAREALFDALDALLGADT